jgi:RNA polymerase sigma factor (sigma-70 family)
MTRRLRNSLQRPGRQRPLIVRARDKPELFAEFYGETYQQVLRFFAREVLDPELAFDLTAETFAAAFEALPAFRGRTEAEGYAWLWTIARRQLFRHGDRDRAATTAIQRLGLDVKPLTDVEFERAEELADLSARLPEIHAALDHLGYDQREAITMRVIEEQPYGVIARELGVTEPVVRARVSRGLRELADLLAPQPPQLEDHSR